MVSGTMGRALGYLFNSVSKQTLKIVVNGLSYAGSSRRNVAMGRGQIRLLLHCVLLLRPKPCLIRTAGLADSCGRYEFNIHT